MRKINFFDGAQSSTVPTIGTIPTTEFVQYANDAAFEAANAGSPYAGQAYHNTTLNVIRYYNGIKWLSIEDEDITAVDVDYNNATSALVATDVQAAIDEVEGRVDQNETDIAAAEQDIDDLETKIGGVNPNNMGTYSGTLLNDNESAKQNIQQLETQAETNAANIASNDTDISNLQTNKEDKSDKGAANGYCPLDGSMLVPAANLPSYVDDVLEFANLAAFPVTGEAGKIYVALDTNFQYRWSGATYIDTTSKVDAVNGKVGNVTINPDDLDDAATTHKFASQAQLDKVNHISVSQAVDLDTMESDIANNNGKVSADGSIDDHSDVDTTTAAPTLNQILKWDGSNWVPANESGGSGQGGINYAINPNFEENIDDVNVTTNVSKAIENTDPIRGSQSLKLSISNIAVPGTDNADLLMNTADNFDLGRKVNVIIEYYTGGGYADELVQFVLRNTDSNVDVPIFNENSGKLKLSANKVRFEGVAYLDDIDNSYNLRMNILGVPGSTADIIIDNWKVTPDEFSPGFVSQGITDFTPIFTNFVLGNGTINYAYWYRRGQFMYGDVNITLGSTSSVTGKILMDVPDNKSMNTNYINSNDSTYMGEAKYQDAGVDSFNGKVEYESPTRIGTYVMRSDGTYVNSAATSGTVPFSFGNTDTFSISFKIPIDGWFDSNKISSRETLFTQAKSFANNVTPTGTLNSSFNKVIFGSVDQDKQDLYNTSTGVWTAPKKGVVKVSADIPLSYTSETGITARVRIINTTTGKYVSDQQFHVGAAIFINPSVSGMLEVNQGDTIEIQASLNAATGLSFNTDSSFSIGYDTDLSIFGVYGETDLIEIQGQPFALNVVTNAWRDITSWQFPSIGEWDALFIAVHRTVGTPPGAALDLFTHVHDVAGNNAGTLTYGDNTGVSITDNKIYRPMVTTFKKIFLVTDTSKTWYFKDSSSVTPAANSVRFDYYKIYARKVK